MSALQQIGIGIIREDGKYVVGVRATTTALPGFAEFPGGKREGEEAIEETVRRECLEETGLEVDVVQLFSLTTFDYPHSNLELHFYLCRPKSGSRSDLAGNFRWVEKWELAALQFPPANAEVLQRLAELDG